MALATHFQLPVLLHLLILLLLLHQSAATRLAIVIAPSRTVIRGQKVRVSCYIDDMAKISMASFSLYLYCPIFKSRISCFQNCHNSCADVSQCPQREALNAFACTRYSSGRSLTYEYTLASAHERHAGNYRCSFYGLSSETVKLNVLDPALLRPEEPSPTTKAPVVAPPTPRPPLPRPPVVLPTRTTRRSWGGRRDPWRPTVRGTTSTKAPVGSVKREEGAPVAPPTGTDEATRRTHIRKGVKHLVRMGEKLLFVVILLFIFSLVINSVFCIRCILIYFYGNSRRKVRMGNLLCMNEEIRVIREIKDPKYLPYSPVAELKAPLMSQHPLPMVPNTAAATKHPQQVFRRQHSAPAAQHRHSYQQYQTQPRPHSQQSMPDDTTMPRVMRVVSEIELQPGEVLDDQTVMYVPLPVVVQRNGSVPNANGTASRRPLSVVFQPGEEGHVVTSRPRLSTSVSGIDRLRRSSHELPHRMLSIESVFEMETLHE